MNVNNFPVFFSFSKKQSIMFFSLMKLPGVEICIPLYLSIDVCVNFIKKKKKVLIQRKI